MSTSIMIHMASDTPRSFLELVQIRRRFAAVSRFEILEGFEAFIRERVQMVFHWLLRGRQMLGAFNILVFRGRPRLQSMLA
jgi:hypothetical protein